MRGGSSVSLVLPLRTNNHTEPTWVSRHTTLSIPLCQSTSPLPQHRSQRTGLLSGRHCPRMPVATSAPLRQLFLQCEPFHTPPTTKRKRVRGCECGLMRSAVWFHHRTLALVPNPFSTRFQPVFPFQQALLHCCIASQRAEPASTSNPVHAGGCQAGGGAWDGGIQPYGMQSHTRSAASSAAMPRHSDSSPFSMWRWPPPHGTPGVPPICFSETELVKVKDTRDSHVVSGSFGSALNDCT